MYHLWQKVKLYKRPASELINLDEFCEDLTGLPAPDALTAWQFDNAVEYLGRFIDHKVNQLDKEGNAVHKLEDLLLDQAAKKQVTAQTASAITQEFGGFVIGMASLLNDPAYLAQVEAGLVKPPPNWPTTQH